MTIDEVRKHKEEAEAEIHFVLQKLHKATGICPTAVAIDLLDTTNIGSPRRQFHVRRAEIEMEPI